MKHLFRTWSSWPERRRTVLTLLILILFVGAVSAVALAKQSLRLDEAQSLWQTSRSPMTIFNIISQDVHVPLYSLILHFWQVLFGNGVTGARTLSLIFYVATIPMVYLVGRETLGRTIGLFSAVLFAISPFMNWYGNEIRMYTLLTLLSVISHFFFLRVFRRGSAGDWFGFGLTTVLGMYTHYFFAFILLGQALFYLAYRTQFPRRSFRKFLLVAVILALAFAPWIWLVLHNGSAGNTRPNLASPSSVDVFNTFSQFLFGFQNDHLNALILSLWPVSVLLGFFALRKGRQVSPNAVYFFIATTLPIVAAYVISVVATPVFLSRYLVISLPPLYLFVGWLFAGYTPKLAKVVRTMLIIGMLVTLAYETLSPAVPVKEDYRTASETIAAETGPQDVVILSAPFTVYPFEYYYQGPAAVETLPIWDRKKYGAIPAFNAATLPDEVKQISGTHRYAYLLLSFDQGYEKDIKTYFDTRFQRLKAVTFSPDLTLYVYQLRYDPPVALAP